MIFTVWEKGRETMNKITGNTSVAEIVKLCPNVRRIFDRHGLKGCGGEHGPSEPLAFFAAVHQANVDELLREINTELVGLTKKVSGARESFYKSEKAKW